MRRGSVLLAAVAVVLVGPAGMLLAQTKAGPEFHVNTYTTQAQFKADVAVGGNGNFVITWTSYTQDGDYAGIFAQRYDRAGNSLGGEFRVNTTTTSYQYIPHAAADAKGNFVVVWTSYGQDGDSYGVFGQRYDASGNPRGGEFQVNTYTTGYQGGPTQGVLSTLNVSMNASGSFVVVWNGYGPTATSTYGVFARRYDRNGTAVGAEFLLNQDTAATSVFPSAKLADDGSFVVVWGAPDGANFGVVGRRFGASGSPIGGEFQVNQYTTGFQQFGSVDFTGTDGSFVVTWNSQLQDGSYYSVMARRFDGSGTAIGSEFRVNTYTAGQQYGLPPKVRADQAGNFVVAWTSEQDGGGGSYGPYGVFAQRFAANGTPRGAEFQVNTFTTNFQDLPQLDVGPAGNFIVAWRSNGEEAPGTSGIYAQRFGGLQPNALVADPSPGNLVWEPGETAVLRPNWLNFNGAAQTFGGTLTNLTGPAGATYTLTDGTGDYGTVANNANGTCTDCYSVTVDNPTTRPVQHWDASALETITPDAQGQVKRWSLHIGKSFTDVPNTNPFYRFVETLLHFGVTGGCGGTNYCPSTSTTRDQMSVFVLVAKEGAGYTPVACGTPVFADVPASNPFCRFIEELARRGVVSGCGNGNYCPTSPVTRDAMSVFALRTLDPALNPPACVAGSEMFLDVPSTNGFCRWIEELARRGVVSGCGNGNYCPTSAVTREQMGVFISATFGLTLYGL
jgi:hypothetical protein